MDPEEWQIINVLAPIILNTVEGCIVDIGIGRSTEILANHAKQLNKRSLEKSGKLAIDAGADAIIVTGDWTGNAPQPEKLKQLRKNIGSFPIFVGSGADDSNISSLMSFATGVIVSTSLKEGGKHRDEINVKKYSQRISRKKVAEFIKASRV